MTTAAETAALFEELLSAVRATRPPHLHDTYFLRSLSCTVGRATLPAGVTKINLVIGNFLEASKV